MSKSKKKNDKSPVCVFCRAPQPSSMYCYGCREHICENCDQEAPFGVHKASEHLMSLERVTELRAVAEKLHAANDTIEDLWAVIRKLT
jgi:predicted amidophosphoribosyltransferase